MSRLVLVTGATGYVGGRLVPALVSRGERVRCLVRRPEEARKRLPSQVEIAAGDMLDPGTLGAAVAGVDTAFYLVHALGSGGDLWREETEAAGHFARAAERAGVRRIVYLGGLGNGSRLSPHLATRQAVGRSSARAVFRRSSFARRSFSVREVCRSR